MDNVLQYLLLGSVFVLVSGLILVGFRMMARRRQREMARLQSDTSSDPSIGSTPELVLGDLTPALAGQVPMGEENKSELQRELRQAGYYKPTAVMEYAAVRTALIIVPLLAGGVASLFAVNLTQVFWIWLVALVVAALGFSLPRVYLYFKGKARMQAIELGMPTAIDMLTLCLSAGLNVHSSLRRVSEELQFAYPTLAYELGIMRQQAELRSLEFALQQFAERVGLPQARNLSVILTQSENLGTDAVTVLREYADNMRINQRQRAEELANKAPFKLLFPAYLMAFGAAIFLIAPTVLEIDAFRKENMIGEGINEARGRIDNLNTSPNPALAPRQPARGR